MTDSIHRMPFGAEYRDGKARFRLWAPAARRVDLCLDGRADRTIEMRQQPGGWHGVDLDDLSPGARYRYRIDSDLVVPDPASRYQPDDLQGPAELLDPTAFQWTDGGWRGRPWEEAVIYELHVGSFSPAGTYDGVLDRLDHLVELGVTAIELMPLSEVPGKRNWGYDGVLPFAPESAYGHPDRLKHLIDTAHRRGIMVFLDVVYNHFGPEGNYLSCYAPQMFTERHHTPWGAAINFDGGCRPVRDFFIHNALYWLEEYHIDGLRFDAIHAILDDSQPDIMTELAETVAAQFAGQRHVHLMLENDNNAARYLGCGADGPRGFAAQWNDDWHHAFHVVLSGDVSGYFEDYAEAPVDRLGRCLTEGFDYQGETSRHRGGRRRGEPSAHLPPTAFISFLQNHDQVGNRGERMTALSDPEAIRAAVTVLLLAPQIPLLFMGEEWGSRQPFHFFCDFHDELAVLVREGRRVEFAKFPHFSDPRALDLVPDPNGETTFRETLLDWAATRNGDGAAWLALYRDLLQVRRREIVPLLAHIGGNAGRFQRHGEHGLSVEWTVTEGPRLCLFANLGPATLDPAPRPPAGRVIASCGEGTRDAIASGRWPPWSVAWMLTAGTTRS